ncbi:type II secretion system minor pseudopilin GspK [Pseudomaricurvus alkylphenolicus]|uniref:type II secretion system minor pseudopilin GspK n=1 Tax=Pseudomaricurvus alkylphenolicus TaxID=1306991 RepID=UPI001421F034|nr:type II secretion system minor pseudopilin GspK [Pseudomaricurvus alkylphenolicus]NIB44470.1 type II secretion system minor pseudopilin GspK [Pseudomaricurvus alkylphenolicus]
MTLPGQQRGVALISILLIFTLVVILVSGAITRAGLDIRKSEFHLHYAQAYQFALGGEALARQLLFRDWKEDTAQNKVDHLGDKWNGTFDFEPDGGKMRVEIEDLHGRLNLNSLLAGNSENEIQYNALKRLLESLNLPDTLAPQFLDWIDQNTSPKAARSEDVYFQGLTPPFRSADNLFGDVSEIQAIQPLTAEQSGALLPHITVLPELTQINPNTASEAIIGSLHQELDAGKIIAERQNEYYSDVEKFTQSDAFSGMHIGDLNAQLTVTSTFFEVRVTAQYQQQTIYLRSLLHRDPVTGTIETLGRNLQPPEQSNTANR